jgi:hypothetical protein
VKNRKTSILDGILSLTQLAKSAPGILFRGQRSPGLLRSRGATDPMFLRLSGRWEHATVALETVAKSLPDSQRKGTWDVIANCRVGDGREFASRATARLGFPEPLRGAIGSAVLLQLDPRRLAEPSVASEMVEGVKSDGANLASVLADLKVRQEQEFEALQARLRSVVPMFESLKFDQVRIERTELQEFASEDQLGETVFRKVARRLAGYQLLLSFTAGPDLPAHVASEGTLLTLGLLTVLSREPVPSLVMIDELERGLHPKALGELVRQIRALMEGFPNLQVIGTTHSPYLVDHFEPDEIRLTTMQDDGSVLVGSLNEHPDFERWKDEMKPGEFWSTVGEDWLRERKEPAGG